MLRFKAIFLVLVFFFGGSGLSIDLAQCCNSISGISIGIGKSNSDLPCECSDSENNSACCHDIVIQSVINQSLAITDPVKLIRTPFVPMVVFPFLNFDYSVASQETKLICESVDHNYPIPILLKKRVLII